MKNNRLKKYLCGLFTGIFMILSCEEATIETDTGNATFETFEDLVAQRLPGIYAGLRSNALYRQAGLLGTWSDAGIDTHHGIVFPLEYNPYYNYSYEAGSLLIGQTWVEFYNAIKQINIFLAQIDQFSVAASEKNPVIGEALFLRGLLYFDMVKIWGNIPLVLSQDINETTALDTVLEDGLLPNNTAEEVYLQIIKDLEFAKSFAPSRVGASQDIASKEAAQALLGKVYLQMTTTKLYGGVEGGLDSNGNAVTVEERFQMAEKELKAVIDSGNFALEEEYADVFTNELDNSEVIFAVGYDGPNQNVGSDFGDFLGEGNQRDGGSFSAYRANRDFAFSYLEGNTLVDNGTEEPLVIDNTPGQTPVINDMIYDDGLTNFNNNAILLGVENFIADVRFEHNIARKDFNSIANIARGENDSDPLREINIQNLLASRWSPFKYIKPLPNPNPAGEGTIDFPFLRYADVLLMEAEALNALGQVDEAKKYVNIVRERALKDFVLQSIPAFINPELDSPEKFEEENELNLVFPTRTSVGTPSSVIANAVINNRVKVDNDDFLLGDETLTQDEMLAIIISERNKELCYEGKRKDDLIRTGKLQEALDNFHPASGGLGSPLIVSGGFSLDRHTHWPIPQDEIFVNPNLQQNCEYGSSEAGCFDL